MQLTSPDQQTACSVARGMLQQDVLDAHRIPIGSQNYVFAVSTHSGEYVLRMTTPEWRSSYSSAINLQKLLLPLDIPVVPFLAHDLEGTHSPFPSLLMPRVPGKDLVIVYPTLSNQQKIQLADKMTEIQAKTSALKQGAGFGFARGGERAPYASWPDFIASRWQWCAEQLISGNLINTDDAEAGRKITNRVMQRFKDQPSYLFIWDMAEKNVMIHNGLLTGIVDVDTVCWGDPLYTTALAASAFEMEGWDSTYADRWLSHYCKEDGARERFEVYRLFWIANFIRSAGQVRANGNVNTGNRERLTRMLGEALYRMGA